MPVKITRDDTLRTTRYELGGRVFELRDLRIKEQKRAVSEISRILAEKLDKMNADTTPKGLLTFFSDEFPALVSELWAILFRPTEPATQDWLEESLDNQDIIDVAKRVIKDNHLEGFGGLLSGFFQRTFDAKSRQAARQAAEQG